MNYLYFACRDCKIYIDAGYRWAYWKLEESGTVRRSESVKVEPVLDSEEYWNPPEDEGSRWLHEGVLPPLRQFLSDHRSHHLTFDEKQNFAPIEGPDYFDWMQIGYLAEPSPRYFVETLAFTSWNQVRDYVNYLAIPPAWWEVTWIDPSPHDRAKQKFHELIRESC